MKFPKLNTEELIVGAVAGALSVVFLKAFGVLVAVASAVLWALGGAENSNKLFRRAGVPALMCGATWFAVHTYGLAVSFVLMIVVLCQGYGIPTIAPGRPDNDPGSGLGRFFYEKTNSLALANILTRATLWGAFILAYYLPIFLGKFFKV